MVFPLEQFKKNLIFFLNVPLCSKPSKLSNKLFIQKANEIHNNKYDYSKVNYITGQKIIIICKNHGEFEQLPYNYLAGHNCPICSNRHKITYELFIEKANKIYNNKYNYSEINYKKQPYINNQSFII